MSPPPSLSTSRDSPLEPASDAESVAHRHATAFTLALDLDEATEDQLEQVYRRAAGCRTCYGALETLAYWLAALDHWSPRVGPELLTRHALFGELFAVPESHRDRLARAQSNEIFHHWGLCRLLLDHSRAAGRDALAFAQEMAELALVLARALDSDFYHPRWAADLRAEVAVQLGGVLRLRGAHRRSEDQLRAARSWLAAGTGRPAVARRIRATESLFSEHFQGSSEAPEVRDLPPLPDSSPRIDPQPGPVHQLLRLLASARSQTRHSL